MEVHHASVMYPRRTGEDVIPGTEVTGDYELCDFGAGT